MLYNIFKISLELRMEELQRRRQGLRETHRTPTSSPVRGSEAFQLLSSVCCCFMCTNTPFCRSVSDIETAFHATPMNLEFSNYIVIIWNARDEFRTTHGQFVVPLDELESCTDAWRVKSNTLNCVCARKILETLSKYLERRQINVVLISIHPFPEW